jgi:PKD repeat protein
MTKGLLVLLALVCLCGTASAMGSLNYNLSWNVISGGGGSLSSPSYSMGSTVGQITGLSSSSSYKLQSGFWVTDDTTCGSGLIPLPGFTNPPTDPDGDCLFEDLNANARKDFNDVVLMFNQMQWIAENEPFAAFDFNGNGRIDFNDIVMLFGEI